MLMSLVITVTLDQSSYTVNEDAEIIQPTLVFSNPSLFNEIVEVIGTYVSINGMVNSVHMYYVYRCVHNTYIHMYICMVKCKRKLTFFNYSSTKITKVVTNTYLIYLNIL